MSHNEDTSEHSQQQKTQAFAYAVLDAPVITLYKHYNMKGGKREVSSEESDLGSMSFNDKASSCVVKGVPWELFVEPDFKGQSIVLLPGSYSTASEMGLPNDSISSLRPLTGAHHCMYILTLIFLYNTF